MSQRNSLLSGRAALVTAHPSHELRVHRWIELARPIVFMLADGTGSLGRTEGLPSTERIIRRAGGEPGSIFGAFAERDSYSALLRHDHAFFIDLAEELTTALIRHDIDYLAGDAIEGTILVHDITRLVVDASVALAGQRRGRPIANYDYLLEGPPDACPEELRRRSIWVQLDEEAFQRKTQAAMTFAVDTNIDKELNVFLGKDNLDPNFVAPAEVLLRLGEQAIARKLEAAKLYRSFAEEINRAVVGEGLDAYKTECLRPATPFSQALALQRGDKPLYEEYGEKLVAFGFYKEVIRLREHVLPLMHALQTHVKKQAPALPQRTLLRQAS